MITPRDTPTVTIVAEQGPGPVEDHHYKRLMLVMMDVLAGTLGGEAHIGAMGGNTKVVTPTITVDTNAYSAGDSIGGKITLTDAMRVSGGTGVLSGITLVDRANQKPALEIFLFESDPSAATITDQSAFAFSTDDTKLVAKVIVTADDWTTIDSKAVADLANLNRVVAASGSKNLYAAIVATGTPDFAAATDLKARFKFFQD